MATHPYADLPRRAFWRSAISERSALELEGLYEPRFAVDRQDRIATAGSCFAQHIGRNFRERGYGFLDLEPAPALLPKAEHLTYGYGMYSARFGNLYTPRQLVQLFERAEGGRAPVEDVWIEADGRHVDPFRPTIEPGGFADAADYAAARGAHLAAVRRIPTETDLFVFTFGLTESWRDTRDGSVYPTCPGTVHGEFDPAHHEFVNFRHRELLEDFESFMAMMLAANPAVRFLITVSPVPLTATASGGHVLSATMASKSTLRSVCAELVASHSQVDYFPSYELVASHPMRAMFFEPNLRTVARRGVAHVMDYFFTAHGEPSAAAPAAPVAAPVAASGAAPAGPAVPAGSGSAADDDVVCDEAILEAFGR
ncbi:GSCFA domain-containing protein [Nocardioides sp.]|uniref:GSCFA domain-containing protein n=1 Tax=Nocardioides sp. TaxID=35761 RepID=UPI003515AA73